MTLDTKLIDAGRIYKAYAPRLEKLGISTFHDLLFHIPFRYDDFTLISKIGSLQAGETVTIRGTVKQIKNQYLKGYKTLQKATLADDTGEIDVTWFNQPFLAKNISAGDEIALSGRVDTFARKIVMQSPDYEIVGMGGSDELIHTGRLVPVYPETRGITSRWMRRQIYGLLQDHLSEVQDVLPEDIRERNHLIPLIEALQKIHFPQSIDEALIARERLSFDELYFLQLRAIKKRKEWQQKHDGHTMEIGKYDEKIRRLRDALPFILTNSQQNGINEIFSNLKGKEPMNRLLQGDVGSGKTIVAAFAMYAVYLNNYQSLLMAPTEILANQHYNTVKTLLEPFGVRVGLVTGSKKIGIKNKEVKSKRIQNSFDILIGTHALLSEKLTFDKLGLVVIDEQQRFGVNQRSLLRKKGESPHILTMTATPIPRTVALTLYGELDVSYLSDMPHGRKLIKTWLVPTEKRDPGYEWIRKQIKETDSQAFIICPFIEESENMTTVKAAKKEFERLQTEIYPDLKLGLLHGKLKSKEKDEVLRAFKNRECDVLIATPVVEVGIDIPNATIIVIEAAERFGLAQLHQLRGRVGRGEKQSYCLLFTESPSTTTVERLKAMETKHIGAELAELDLRLRGPGEIFGTMQHGSRKLKYASYLDLLLIEKAKKEASRTFSNIENYPAIMEQLAKEDDITISPD